MGILENEARKAIVPARDIIVVAYGCNHTKSFRDGTTEADIALSYAQAGQPCPACRKVNAFTRFGELTSSGDVKITRKRNFLKALAPFVPAHAEKEWEKQEQWKAIALGYIQFNAGKIPTELGKELLRYLYRVRSKWEKNFKRKFGYYPSYEEILENG